MGCRRCGKNCAGLGYEKHGKPICPKCREELFPGGPPKPSPGRNYKAEYRKRKLARWKKANASS